MKRGLQIFTGIKKAKKATQLLTWAISYGKGRMTEDGAKSNGEQWNRKITFRELGPFQETFLVPRVEAIGNMFPAAFQNCYEAVIALCFPSPFC